MTLVQRKQEFLDCLRSEGRSSPEGMHWHDFYVFLQRRKAEPEHPDPPRPLILAASSESDCSKHQRLSDQLDWAIDNNCLHEALEYLKAIDPQRWNRSSVENWDREFF